MRTAGHSRAIFLFWSVTVGLSTSCTSAESVISHGLSNLGNTCYLNSQLQCAFHIPKVRNLIAYPPPVIISLVEEGDEADERTSTTETSTESTIESNESVQNDPNKHTPEPAEEQMPIKPEESLALQALRQVFADMKRSSRPVAPRALCNMLGIPVMEQQDSQEFWKLLLPALQLPSLVDLYQGSFEDYIKAADDSDKRERRREEPFLDLSLDVSRESVLEGLKESFGKPELLSVKEGNGWRPEKGADKIDAFKGSLLRVQGLPSILQLHLKRFNYDWQHDRMSKLNNKCSFPEELDLSDLCADITEPERETACYLLQSIVVHVGEFGSGHYYSYVRPNIQSNDWYRFNDHVVTPVAWEEVIADAYGGRHARLKCPSKQASNGFLRRIQSLFQPRQAPFGFGGRTSNAYVVQYVRRCDIPSLYLLDN